MRFRCVVGDRVGVLESIRLSMNCEAEGGRRAESGTWCVHNARVSDGLSHFAIVDLVRLGLWCVNFKEGDSDPLGHLLELVLEEGGCRSICPGHPVEHMSIV